MKRVYRYLSFLLLMWVWVVQLAPTVGLLLFHCRTPGAPYLRVVFLYNRFLDA